MDPRRRTPIKLACAIDFVDPAVLSDAAPPMLYVPVYSSRIVRTPSHISRIILHAPSDDFIEHWIDIGTEGGKGVQALKDELARAVSLEEHKVYRR